MARILLLLSALLLAGWCRAQDAASKVDAFISAFAQERRFMGSVLLAREGKVIFKKGYGMANLEHDVPNTPKTKFRLGSITKQFTATAILQLEERGKLKVEDPICQYLSPCPAHWQPITIHHLLSHTSGIPNFTSFPGYRQEWVLPSPPAQTMLKFKDKPLDFEPGAKWSYSNSGYILLALILEKASGVGYAAYLEQNIFGPLGMKDSGHDEWAPVLKNRATGYSGTGDAMVHAPYHDMSIPIGGGDLYSTVEDLLLWDQALYGEKVLSRKSIDRMFTPVLNNYGYGWSIQTHNGRKVINHAGGINGFRDVHRALPGAKGLPGDPEQQQQCAGAGRGPGDGGLRAGG